MSRQIASNFKDICTGAVNFPSSGSGASAVFKTNNTCFTITNYNISLYLMLFKMWLYIGRGFSSFEGGPSLGVISSPCGFHQERAQVSDGGQLLAIVFGRI